MIKKIKENNLFIKHKKYFRFFFFCLVGVMANLIYFLFFNFFRFWINQDFVISMLLATSFSIIFNFSVNRNITFSARGYSIKKQLPKYLLVYAVAIGSNFIVALSVKNILGVGFIQENLAILSGLVVSIPISFSGSLFWAFKK